MSVPKITAEHRADVARYGRDVFLDAELSTALHSRLDVTEPWSEWEWPRRLAALERRPEQMRMEP